MSERCNLHPTPALYPWCIDRACSDVHQLDVHEKCMTLGDSLPPSTLRSLTIVHGSHFSSTFLTNQAHTFSLSSHSWIVHGALVLAFNGPAEASPVARVERALMAYPHRLKHFCRVPNYGYKCGQFATWHALSSEWSRDRVAATTSNMSKRGRHPNPNGGRYEVVLTLNTDVFLSPRAFALIEYALILSNATWLIDGFDGRGREFQTDFFAFRPHGLQLVGHNYAHGATVFSEALRACNPRCFNPKTEAIFFHQTRRVTAPAFHELWHLHNESWCPFPRERWWKPYSPAWYPEGVASGSRSLLCRERHHRATDFGLKHSHWPLAEVGLWNVATWLRRAIGINITRDAFWTSKAP